MKKIFLLTLVSFSIGSIYAQNKLITLEDIWAKSTFKANNIYGLNSMNDGLHYTTQEGNDIENYIVKYSYKTGKVVDTLLKSSSLLKPLNKEVFDIDDYTFSKSEDKLLISSESEQIYRHSSRSSYYVYDLKTKKVQAVDDKEKQQLPDFSPNSDKVAFVKNNNLYLKNLSTNEIKQITFNGKRNEIINGVPDWVYEEEFSFSKAFEWNADGTLLAYYQFDESKVKEFSMQTYGKLYPENYTFKYPKAGEANAVVSIYIYNVATGATQTVDIGKDAEQYIPRIFWTKDPNVLCVTKLNRLQNRLDVVLADAKAGTSKTILTETSDTYIDLHENPKVEFITFLNDKKSFVMCSEKDGFNHIYLFDISGKQTCQVTTGKFDVTEVCGIDEKTGTVYYSSSETSSTEKCLYSIKLNGTSKIKLSAATGWNESTFSSGLNYFINTFSDANTPYLITLCDSKGKQIRVMEDNSKLKETMKTFALSKKAMFSFKTTENIALDGWMIKPPDFDATKKYPVFVTFYGGPGISIAFNKWDGRDLFWHQLLAQKGYIVVCVDGRGTGHKGREFKNCTYKQLGKYEVADQIEVAKYLGNLPYVDKTRIGCEGWSFGGYLTSLCMTKGADYFKTGIAVAPVTNWRFYDTIYTERFLQTPQQNPTGYDDNSPINHVSKLKGKFLLIHGTGDDNVHFQNSVEMTTALIKAGKQFDSFYYPDKNHSISGGNTRLHLYTKMTDFILQNL